MKTIIVAINAKNIHKALAPWCLKAYCESKGLKDIGVIECSINDNINEITGMVYNSKPDILAFSCYIWNIEYVVKVGGMVKKLLPGVKIILGGPEVSFEEDLSSYPFADFLIKGQGERAFFELLSNIQNNALIENKIIESFNEDFSGFPPPFTDEYFLSFKNDQISSIENRLIYYESSRGCPFSCSYCLSSLFKSLHYLPIGRVKNDLLKLIEVGAKCIKFVDRTFNSNLQRAKEILEFIYSLNTGCVFHFEAAADLFDEELFKIIKKMPVGRIQFEIGIQSVNEKTLKSVNRKTDIELALKNIKKLTSFQNSHIHVDLIAGMPFETINTFTKAINKALECKPHKLQLGFLKMLKGAKVRRENFGAVFSNFPPYEVYQTDSLSYGDILKLKKIESLIERFYNSGAFTDSISYAIEIFKTPYRFFEEFSNYCESSINFKVSLKNAYTVLLNFLLLHGEKIRAEHCIKSDCLSFDSKGMLPDSVKPERNKQAELIYRQHLNKGAEFRIEFFKFTLEHKLFLYESKNAVTNRYFFKTIDVLEYI